VGLVVAMSSALGVDPRADSRNGETVIARSPAWSVERWDAYQRGLVDYSYAMWLAGHPLEARNDELR
jgi:hypothetical protein